MQHKVKVTVLDKKLYPELQAQYCAVPESGKCPCFNVGDEFIFFRNNERDDFWHCGEGTLVKAGQPDEGCLQSPGTAHSGSKGVPFCSEAWDAIARYIYTGLQGGSIMRGWMKDERVMITCCSDGTRPVIFKIERLDYFAVRFKGGPGDTECEQIRSLLGKVEGVTDVVFRKEAEGEYAEVYAEPSVATEEILNAVKEQKNFRIVRID